MDIDDLEDFSHLYVSDSDEDDEEENRFGFDFSRITNSPSKPELETKEVNGNNSNNKYIEPDFESTYVPDIHGTVLYLNVKK